MVILSHRGYWKDVSEKNQLIAFMRSFSLGFGIETDIRDYKGKLVISHDIPNNDCLTVEDFFNMYNKFGNNLPLALNIKADGLQYDLKRLIMKYDINNYFVFDMSIPDTLIYLSQEIKIFARQSEYEKSVLFYENACGIWLDEFLDHWIDKKIIQKHIKRNKQLCIVSPELHQRDYNKEWSHYKQIEKELNIKSLMLCTDYPEIAKGFFNE